MRVLGRSAALATAGALLAGCAGGPGGGGGKISDDKIVLAVLTDQSGVYADLSGKNAVESVKMAVADFKAKYGDKAVSSNIEVISADHQNKPDISSNIARQWFDTEGVDAIFDVPTSSAALAVSQVTKEKDKILIDSGAGSTDLTGKACNANTIHWTYDTYALAKGTGSALVAEGLDTWFFITADYEFGHSLEENTSAVVEAAGGQVLGAVRTPFPAQDFSSFLLQAQSSGAKVIGLANAGGDTVNAIKQANEFGIVQGGQTLAGLLIFITDIHALGLETAQGLVLTEAFYWDLNDDTRAWSERFAERRGGAMPTMVHAGVYSGLLHYLKAVEATGGKDTEALMAWMKGNPTSDPLFGEGKVRADGRTVHDMYLFRVKAPDASKGPWDYYELVRTIPGDEAFRPIEEGGCPLVN